jgi:hypothetical protein
MGKSYKRRGFGGGNYICPFAIRASPAARIAKDLQSLDEGGSRVINRIAVVC